MAIFHVCDICDTEIDGDYCQAHPDATVSSVYAPVEGEDTPAFSLCCDRCGDTAAGIPGELVDAAYLIDDPYTATGNLCPDCALQDDQNHIVGSWLLTWSA